MVQHYFQGEYIGYLMLPNVDLIAEITQTVWIPAECTGIECHVWQCRNCMKDSIEMSCCLFQHYSIRQKRIV